jgi:heme oxygenase
MRSEIMLRLREATRPHHEHMEVVSQSPRLASGNLSLAEYRQMLIQHYRFHAWAEPRLAVLVQPVGLSYEERGKVRALQAELHDLGVDVAALAPISPAALSLDTLPQALGCMYVLEGSTLGGNVIRRTLAQQPEIAAHTSFQYFGCYGDALSQRWRAFCECVSIHLTEEAQQQAAIAAAQATFIAFAALFADEALLAEA